MGIMNFNVGIDPGASGGISVYMQGEQEFLAGKLMMPLPIPTYLATTPMIEDRKELYEWIKDYCTNILSQATRDNILVKPQPVSFHCCIEEVSGYIGNAHPGAAMFNFGMNYGTLLTILDILNIKYTLVKPAVWQKALGIEPRRKGSNKLKEESKEAFKRRLKDHALKLFTNYREQVTLKTCDSMLIAYYCMLINKK